ncbi:alpha/beta fold hydrolase [Nocardioides sp.]|uniref:alpha/beta fold hydrolase n=1 Tax=Nocardioides sp. TaxID=35761 RepID=UPI0027176EC1|nr:alpha/beta hydrolase [Nocardioides sp.]MDO9455366.1 alpha/beta hydrolase [Nocardioides sp.]
MTETSPPTVPVRTATVGEGAAAVTYDVHGDLGTATPERPALFLLGSPMDASGFATLASHFTDRPVVTYDPRGAARNPTDTAPITADEHASDIAAVIAALAEQGAGPVDVFASSGGAVNILRLVETHPDVVRRVVAHEPPTAMLLPDRDHLLAACADVKATYETSGQGPAMAKFIALVMHSGEVTDDYLDRPAPDPAQFGMSADDDGTRTDPLMRNFPGCNRYQPDLDALAVLGDRLVVAGGAGSHDEMAVRGGRSIAEALGRELTVFPGDHGGFLGGEYGQTGEPDAFAARLHAVLDA